MERFVVTDEWLEQFATARCGWTLAQLKVLGVAWPPVRGWRRRVVGLVLTPAQKEAFERGRFIRRKHRQTDAKRDLQRSLAESFFGPDPDDPRYA